MMVKADDTIIAPATVIGLREAFNFARTAVSITIEARLNVKQRRVAFPFVLLIKGLFNSIGFKRAH